MHRVLVLLPVGALVAACGGGSMGSEARSGDIAPGSHKTVKFTFAA